MSSNKLKNILLLTVLIGLPTALFFLPIDYFDSGESLCPSKRFFDVECPGCGITRSGMRFIHFDFLGAWQFNKLIIIVAPLFAYYWIKWFIQSFRAVFLVSDEATNHNGSNPND